MTYQTVTIDALDAIELAEVCEFLAGWLAAEPVAAAGYDRHVGHPGQAVELQADPARLANLLLTAEMSR